MLREDSKVWNIHGVLNILYSLVEKSNINQQLQAFLSGEDPSSVAGLFGSHSLYKNLGYFSLIGLLRLHCQLGDYHTALKSVENIHLSKKVLATTRVPASQIALYYYMGFSYFMMRKYRDTVRVFSNIIVFIQRVKQHFQPKSYQFDLVVKQNDQMLYILAMVLTLYPQHVDEAVNSQLKDRRFQEDMTKLQDGDTATFKKLFLQCCPKFISPVPPDYEALPDNYNYKAPTEHQCNLFMRELEPQLILPVIRSYLKFYTTMPVAKLASFMEKVLLCIFD
jgi:translation initiation factor 3 subunit L